MWDHTIEQLKQSFRVIRFDARGTGQSVGDATSKDEAFYHFDRYHEDVLEVLDDLGVNKVHVWSLQVTNRSLLRSRSG